MGMTPDGTLKFNCDISFTNMSRHPVTQKMMSMPSELPAENGWTAGKFPEALRERCKAVLAGSYGNLLDGYEIDKYRICWYVIPLSSPNRSMPWPPSSARRRNGNG